MRNILPNVFLSAIIFYSLYGLLFSLGISFINLNDFLRALIQTTLSTVAVCVVGLVSGFAISSVSKKYRFAILILALVPQFVPSNFFMISTIMALDFLNWKVEGVAGVVLFHTILNAGLASVMFSTLYEKYLYAYVDIQNIFSVSKWRFFVAILKSGFLINSAAIFIFFLIIHSLSFSIPLILSDKTLSFEQILYDSLIQGQALFSVFVIGLFYSLLSLVKKEMNMISPYLKSSSSLRACSLKNIPGFFILIIPSALFLIHILRAPGSFEGVGSELPLLLKAFRGQLEILLVSGCLFFLTIMFGLKKDLSKSKLMYFFIPSVSLILFSSFMLSSFEPEFLVIGVGVYLSILIFILALLNSAFINFHKNKEVLLIYNIRDELSLFLKTEKTSVILSFALMSIWVGGDYVFSGSLARNFVSFGSLSRASLARYEIIESQVYSILSLVSSVCFILIFILVVYGKDIRFLPKKR